ncbi:MAG: hypothetical protein PHS49_00055 [Candidatus Gracilibacteria bacterium]|nr:hypothetical protein [Candidatus Gracilibacteria bacterium]
MKKNIKIDLNIYPIDKLKQAIHDFEGAAVIILNNDELTIEGETNEEIDEIFSEFGNYVIGLINE